MSMEPNTMNGHQNTPAVIKTCPRCGASFECLHSPQCWCAAVRLDEKARSELAARYSDCLCPECLAAIAAGASVEPGRAH
jgi:hypothetical protein